MIDSTEKVVLCDEQLQIDERPGLWLNNMLSLHASVSLERM